MRSKRLPTEIEALNELIQPPDSWRTWGDVRGTQVWGFMKDRRERVWSHFGRTVVANLHAHV